MDVSIRAAEGQAAQPLLAWDTVWEPGGGLGDWALAGADAADNRGGLEARAALATAALLCLFSDARVPEGHPWFRFVADDPGGWWGDGVDLRADLGEEALGSYLHALARAPLSAQVAREAEAEIQRALVAVLKRQGVIAHGTVSIAFDASAGRLVGAIALVGRDGREAYAARFEELWRQVA